MLRFNNLSIGTKLGITSGVGVCWLSECSEPWSLAILGSSLRQAMLLMNELLLRSPPSF